MPREDLARFIDDAPALGIRGLSVTIPHKEEVVKKLTEVDGAVRGIGAANTVVFDGKKRLGYNTDYRAAMDSLEAALGGPSEADERLKGKTALVLGAGGVGRAIVYGLTRRGVNVVVTDGVARQALTLGPALRMSLASNGRPGTRSPPTCWSTARRWACTRTSTKRRSRSTTCGRR